MTLADGLLVHIVVPSRAQPCPAQARPAALDGKSLGDVTSSGCISTGNSPAPMIIATEPDDRLPESRTTIA